MHHRYGIRGFTLIELMITLAVIVVLLLIAVPSFQAFQHRSALRGGAEEAMSLWNQARFEAAKRNSLVKYGVVIDGGEYCIGLATTTTTTDEDPCDCLTDGACNIARFPADQGEWRGVSVTATELGQDTGVVVIDPKFTALTELDDAGAVTFADPAGSKSYALNLHIDRMGRGFLCESNASVDHLSDYINRTCDP